MAQPFDPATIRIPTTVAMLGNGLRVVVHRDRKSPIVGVHVAYRAGSREEAPGKYGLAHLFEHLMFSGSEHSRKNYFLPLERIGATSINANAADDYTAYFAAVPASALHYALWMEAERMSCLAGALDQSALDRQREVVRNELRQRQAEPYGRIAHLIRRYAYPPEHPYAHHPYGSLDDLDNISLDDAAGWLETGYGAANATVVIAGDVEPYDAIAQVRRRFETIAAGTPRPPRLPWLAKPERATRLQFDGNQAAGRIYRVWNVPELGSPDRAGLELVCELIAGGESSWLFRRLVQEAGLAAGVSAELQARELGSQIVLCVTVAPEARLEELDSALGAELSRFTSELFSNQELESARARIVSRFIRETERGCGPGSKAEVLAVATLATEDPGTATAHLERMAAPEARQIAEEAARWLDGTNLVIEVHPATRRRTQFKSIVHEGPPKLPDMVGFRWPEVKRSSLANGLRVIHIEREGSGPIELRLVLEPGAAAESPVVGGLTSLAVALLSRTCAPSDRVCVGAELGRLGAIFRGRSALDAGVIEISTMPDDLAFGLSLLGRVVTNPDFEELDLKQVKSRCAAIIRDEAARPLDLAMRCLPSLVYPDRHPYAQPFGGSGTEESLARLTAGQLRDFYSRWLRPNRATLIAVGPVNERELSAVLTQTLGAWEPSRNPIPEAIVPPTEFSDVDLRSRVALIDRPDVAQTGIFAAMRLPPHRDPNIEALTVANAALGGMFGSWLNLALREKHGWSYGVKSQMHHARFGGLWIIHAFVRSDRAGDAMHEMNRQLHRLTRQRSLHETEFVRVRDHLIASLPARYETNAQLTETLRDLVLHDLPDNYYAEMARRLAAQRLRDFTLVCRRQFDATHVAWLVIGDAARISPQVASAGLGTPEIIDAAR